MVFGGSVVYNTVVGYPLDACYCTGTRCTFNKLCSRVYEEKIRRIKMYGIQYLFLFVICVFVYQVVVLALKIFGVITWSWMLVILPALIWVALLIINHFSE